MCLRALRSPEDDAAARALLALSSGTPTAATIARRYARYRREPHWHLCGYVSAGRLVGSLGLEIAAPGAAILRHIAVFPAYRGRGIGRQLIAHALARFRLHHLTAETDREAVGFYRRCGFSITSLGERYPDVERFRCVLRVEASRE